MTRDYTPEEIEAAFAAVTESIRHMMDGFDAAARAFADWYAGLPPDVRERIYERPDVEGGE